MKCPDCGAAIAITELRPRMCCSICGAKLKTNEVLVSAVCVVGGALFGFAIPAGFEWWKQLLVLAANIVLWTRIGVLLTRVRRLPDERES